MPPNIYIECSVNPKKFLGFTDHSMNTLRSFHACEAAILYRVVDLKCHLFVGVGDRRRIFLSKTPKDPKTGSLDLLSRTS